MEAIEQHLHGLGRALQKPVSQRELLCFVLDVADREGRNEMMKGVSREAAAAAQSIFRGEARGQGLHFATHGQRQEAIVLDDCISIGVLRIRSPLHLFPDMKPSMPKRSVTGEVADLDMVS